MEYKQPNHLKLEELGDILWITIDRPEQRNAINRETAEELFDANIAHACSARVWS